MGSSDLSVAFEVGDYIVFLKLTSIEVANLAYDRLVNEKLFCEVSLRTKGLLCVNLPRAIYYSFGYSSSIESSDMRDSAEDRDVICSALRRVGSVL